MFRPWQADVPASIEICPLRLPGREMRLREPPVTDFGTMIAALDAALGPYLDEPYALLGHSIGASIVYELTARLTATGRPLPCHLIVSARQAPHLRREVLSRPVAELSDAELLRDLSSINAGTRAVMADDELAALVLPVLRADLALCQSYVATPRPPLPVPLTVLGGAQDPSVGPAELEPWAEHTTKDFTLRLFPGDHFFLVNDGAPVRRFVAEMLAASPPGGARVPRSEVQ